MRCCFAATLLSFHVAPGQSRSARNSCWLLCCLLLLHEGTLQTFLRRIVVTQELLFLETFALRLAVLPRCGWRWFLLSDLVTIVVDVDVIVIRRTIRCSTETACG
uniref:Putative secreted peptide n=1 Tax=Anopheles braziliensis TaxID=58242 RepID=A0A2M3ZU43_9DIPT